MFGVIGLLYQSFKIISKHATTKYDKVVSISFLSAIIITNLTQIFFITQLNSVQSVFYNSVQDDDFTIQSQSIPKILLISIASVAFTGLNKYLSEYFSTYLHHLLSGNHIDEFCNTKLTTNVKDKDNINNGIARIITKDDKYFGEYTISVLNKFLLSFAHLISGFTTLYYLSLPMLSLSIVSAVAISGLSVIFSNKLRELAEIEEIETNKTLKLAQQFADMRTYLQYDHPAFEYVNKTLKSAISKNTIIRKQSIAFKIVLEGINNIFTMASIPITIAFSIIIKNNFIKTIGDLSKIVTSFNALINIFFIEHREHITTNYLDVVISRLLSYGNGTRKIVNVKDNIGKVEYVDQPIIRLKEVSYSTGDGVIINNASFEIKKYREDGSRRTNIYRLWGDSGAGKSSIFAIIKTFCHQKGIVTIKEKAIFKFLPQKMPTFTNEDVFNTFFPLRTKEMVSRFDDVYKYFTDLSQKKQQFSNNDISNYIKANKLSKYIDPRSDEIKKLIRKNRKKFYSETIIKELSTSLADIIYNRKIEKAEMLCREFGKKEAIFDRCNCDHKIESLSGGEEQIIKIISAILSDPGPDFLFLDETFNGIDKGLIPKIKKVIRRELPDTCIIYISHYVSNYCESLPASPDPSIKESFIYSNEWGVNEYVNEIHIEKGQVSSSEYGRFSAAAAETNNWVNRTDSSSVTKPDKLAGKHAEGARRRRELPKSNSIT